MLLSDAVRPDMNSAQLWMLCTHDQLDCGCYARMTNNSAQLWMLCTHDQLDCGCYARMTNNGCDGCNTNCAQLRWLYGVCALCNRAQKGMQITKGRGSGEHAAPRRISLLQ
jgi:hypothetical protein